MLTGKKLFIIKENTKNVKKLQKKPTTANMTRQTKLKISATKIDYMFMLEF